MATNSRPTTEFHVTYGALSTVSSERTLNPVIIAPRYKIHSYEAGYADAFLGEYSKIIKAGAGVGWPARTEGAVIDTASSEIYAKNPVIQLNSEAISGIVSDSRRNEIKLPSSIQPISAKSGDDNKLDAKLNGFTVQVGDKVKIGGDGIDLYATITGIGASYDEAMVKDAVALNNSKFSGIATSGEYTGSADANYLIKVLETPKTDADKVRIQVIALTGDSGYVASMDAGASPIALGTKGAKIAFTGALQDCVAGDCWSVLCKAAAISSYDTVYVNTELTLEASVSLNFCSSRYSGDYVKLGSGVAMNNAGILVNDGIAISVNSVSCELVEADLFVAYRERLVADADQVVTSSAAGAAEWAGKADPRNPMGLLYAACSGVGEDSFFYMISPASDDDEGYINAINYAAQFESLYSFVTWSDSPAVYAAKQAAVAKYSSPTIAQFKKNWYAPRITNEEVVYDKLDDGGAILASIDAKGSVQLASPANAITGGVAPGDYMVVYSSVNPATGEWLGVRYKVTAVTDADTVVIEDGVETDLSRVEFVRVMNSTQFAKKIAAMAAQINDHRVNLVWCAGQINFGGFSDVPVAVVAAILATTRGALAPHAPMTGLNVPGITLVDTYKFTDVEYELMNAGGVWVVSNNSQGIAVNYHQITTKTDGTVAEEDSCVSAGDAVVREIRNAVAPLTAGTVNVSDQLIADIRTQVGATMAMIMGRPYPSSYGPLVEGYKIKELGRPKSNNAAVMLLMDIDTPQPLLKGQVYANII